MGGACDSYSLEEYMEHFLAIAQETTVFFGHRINPRTSDPFELDFNDSSTSLVVLLATSLKLTGSYKN